MSRRLSNLRMVEISPHNQSLEFRLQAARLNPPKGGTPNNSKKERE